MIRTLRWKVVGMNMLLIAVVLCAVLVGVYFSSRHNMVLSTTQILETALDGGARFGPQRPGSQEGSQPYFLADVMPDGRVLMSGSQYYDLEDEETLLAIVNAALEQENDSGVLAEYQLRYCRRAEMMGYRIAFADSSRETDTLRTLAITLALGGLGALAVLFACSYLLSGLITKPVARAWEAQRRFLSDASHELKTPLTVILSSAELLKNEPQNSGYVDNIAAEGKRMKSLVDSMLTLSRLEYLPQTATEPVDFSDLCEEAALRFEPVAFESGHALDDQVAPGLTVTGDGEKLTQAVGVLLDNAIKYASPDTPITMAVEKSGSKAVLRVENQGDPIPADKVAHLFDRFYRTDESRTGAQGFGLGLAIAQNIAQAHKGALRCESDEKSTRFILTLPLR